MFRQRYRRSRSSAYLRMAPAHILVFRMDVQCRQWGEHLARWHRAPPIISDTRLSPRFASSSCQGRSSYRRSAPRSGLVPSTATESDQTDLVQTGVGISHTLLVVSEDLLSLLASSRVVDCGMIRGVGFGGALYAGHHGLTASRRVL